MQYVHLSLQLTNAGEDVVVFYNDKASFSAMLELMAESREGVGENSPLRLAPTFTGHCSCCGTCMLVKKTIDWLQVKPVMSSTPRRRWVFTTTNVAVGL